MFKLSGPKTYVTLSKKFKEGVAYTPEQVGDLANNLNESGTPLFVEVDGEGVEVGVAEEVGLVEIEEVAPEEVAEEVVEEVAEEVVEEAQAPRKLIVGKKKEG